MGNENATNDKRCLPAEWERQSAVQLTWPHEGTDWAPVLEEVTECYLRMALEIAKREPLIVVTPEAERTRGLLQRNLPARVMANIHILNIPTDDTWARDHGFITLLNGQGEPCLLDFRFNGWGQKFASARDNQICRRMCQAKALRGRYECHLDFILEGGSIESDGKGTLLTTSQCLLAPNRNEPLSQGEIESRLKRWLCCERVLWLDHGALEGDDTDSHIDTLARLCPDDTIAYVQCADRQDAHYEELQLMEQQLKEFRTAEGKPYKLIALPMAEAQYDAEGNRLPATYANFLIMNGAVLMPTYRHEVKDRLAAEALGKAFPDREIVPVDCRILTTQHGSLHCCTMQFPEGVVSL
ncbi:MAG: agmatine deiminase family protein [Prevotellaceae bacterium]|nr:agmatine deiminase family protein [Prevotellaceae bacterium]